MKTNKPRDCLKTVIQNANLFETIFGIWLIFKEFGIFLVALLGRVSRYGYKMKGVTIR